MWLMNLESPIHITEPVVPKFSFNQAEIKTQFPGMDLIPV
jgi:hypothetical protein